MVCLGDSLSSLLTFTCSMFPIFSFSMEFYSFLLFDGSFLLNVFHAFYFSLFFPSFHLELTYYASPHFYYITSFCFNIEACWFSSYIKLITDPLHSLFVCRSYIFFSLVYSFSIFLLILVDIECYYFPSPCLPTFSLSCFASNSSFYISFISCAMFPFLP